MAQLGEAGISCSLCRHAPQGMRLAQGLKLPMRRALTGAWSVCKTNPLQLAAPLLAPQPGERLPDACAAPEGKTAHLLEQQPELVAAAAVDTDAERMQLVEENLKQLRLYAPKHVRLHCADAARPKDWRDGQPFDRILLNSPCSFGRAALPAADGGRQPVLCTPLPTLSTAP